MLEQNGRGERVDIACSVLRSAADLAHGAQRGRGGEPLVDQHDRKPGPRRELRGRSSANFARRAASRRRCFVERKSDDEAALPRVLLRAE